MPRKLVRYRHSGQYHFVAFSCYARQKYLGSANARNTFEKSLEAMRLRYRFLVAGYVVMPERVHLLVRKPA